LPNPAIAPNSLNSWEFPEGSYHTIQYSKSAVWLNTLKKMVGDETFNEAMKTYYLRWKFKHPCAQDFVDVFNEVVKKNHPEEFGEGMDFFFQQALYGTEICDYRIRGIYTSAANTKAGKFENLDNCEKPTSKTDANGKTIYNSSVVVERLGDMILPIDVKVVFDDGSEVLEKWDGKNTIKRFSYEGTKQIECAEVDPQNKIFMDKNFLNNSFTHKPNPAGIREYVNEFFFWMQNAMEGLSIFI
jgi:hypothetical protein